MTDRFTMTVDDEETSIRWKPPTHLIHNIIVTVFLWIFILIVIRFMIILLKDSGFLSNVSVEAIWIFLIAVAIIWTAFLIVMIHRQYRCVVYTKGMRYTGFDICPDLLESRLIERLKREGASCSEFQPSANFNMGVSYEVLYDNEKVLLFFSIGIDYGDLSSILLGPFQSSNIKAIRFITRLIDITVSEIRGGTVPPSSPTL